MSDALEAALREELLRVLGKATAREGACDTVYLRDLARVIKRVSRALDAIAALTSWEDDEATPPRAPAKPVVHLIDDKTVLCGLRSEMRTLAGDTLTILPDDVTCPACKRAMKPAWVPCPECGGLEPRRATCLRCRTHGSLCPDCGGAWQALFHDVPCGRAPKTEPVAEVEP